MAEHLLGAEAISLAYPNRHVLDAVTLGIHTGDRIGVVGRNGEGKSTLLALLSGALAPDSGRVTRRGDVRLAVLPQGDTLEDGWTARDVIVQDRPEHEWLSDARIRSIVEGLCGMISLDTRCGELSGGQRRRVALAATLAGDHDVLLLDEPTNHLDIEAIAWLATHLNTRWPPGSRALAVVTHDRWFLDAVCTSTWEIHDGQVEPFEGGYAAYILQRLERDRQAAASQARRRSILRKELAWLRRGPPARTSKPKFRLEAAAQLIADEPAPRDTLELQRLAVARLGKLVVDLTNASFAYDDGPKVLHEVTWSLGPGERVGILGPNGAGKTTLLGLVTGRLAPTTGRVKIGRSVRTATLTQDADLGDLAEQTVAEAIAERKREYSLGRHVGWGGGGRDARLPGAASGESMSPTAILERLGFAAGHFHTPVKDLSGGQKRRLQLALVLMDEPNVLVLDEPSNDLDTDMLTAMEDLLDSWPGTLVVVTHDRYLMERTTDVQFAVVDQTVRHVPGGVEEYLKMPRPRNQDDGAAREQIGSAGAKARDARKALQACERKLERLKADLAASHEAMAACDPSDYQRLDTLVREASVIQEAIEAEENRWLELAAALE